jgi:hypothetical protein
VGQHGLEQRLDVLGINERAALEQRPGARCALERERAAHRRSHVDDLQHARRADELDQPSLDDRIDVDVLDRRLDASQRADVDHGPDRPERVGVPLGLDDAHLVVQARIAEGRLEEEPIELRLGKGKGPFVVERVLGREDEERVRQRPRLPVGGDLPLGHGLEQGRCVRGIARLISSTRTMLANTGPGRNSNSRSFWL